MTVRPAALIADIASSGQPMPATTRATDGMGDPFVARLRQLTSLEDADIALIDRLRGPARNVRAKTDFVREGKQAEQLHILLRGWACRSKVLPDGRRQITNLLLPGDICNLSALYISRTDRAVGALTDCTFAAIECSELLHLMAQNSRIAKGVGVLLALDNAMLAERSVCLGRRLAREQLAHLLCELRTRLTLIGHAHENVFRLLITQEEIGDTLGLTAVHVNRMLQGLRSEGLIEQRGQQITIREWSALCHMAAFRPGYLHLGVNELDGGHAAPALHRVHQAA